LNSGPWNEIMRSRNVNRGPWNAIMGTLNVSRGRGMGKADLEYDY